jgi:murein DD-endopeptidase MepM/ murein hydrolase activator NlpD
MRIVLGLALLIIVTGCASEPTPGNAHGGAYPDAQASPSKEAEAATKEGDRAPTSVPSDNANVQEIIKGGAGPAAHTLRWPVDNPTLSRGFSVTAVRSPSSRRRPHYGIDIPGKRGTPIFAAHSGLISYVGQDFHGFGRLILIEGAEGLATFYAHLSKFKVREGQYVRAGDQIGEMGRTGRASGVHLHFEVRKDLAPVDPLLFLKD